MCQKTRNAILFPPRFFSLSLSLTATINRPEGESRRKVFFFQLLFMLSRCWQLTLHRIENGFFFHLCKLIEFAGMRAQLQEHLVAQFPSTSTTTKTQTILHRHEDCFLSACKTLVSVPAVSTSGRVLCLSAQ